MSCKIRIYPQWFIDELVNDEDREKAINGSLLNKEKVLFTCPEGHVYMQCVNSHIYSTNGDRKCGCPICGKMKREKNRLETLKNKRIYPQWFIEELVNEEDKVNAINGKLNSKDIVTFRCGNGHEYKQTGGVHINLSTGEKKYGCPCEKNERIQSSLKEHFLKTKKVVYPQWFIDGLVNEEDKVNAIK